MNKGRIIATTVTITTMKTKESDDKSQIKSMGTDKFIPAFLISDLSPPTYLHHHHIYHHHHHHHHHHYYHYYYHYNTNKHLCLNIYIFTAIRECEKNQG